MRQFVIKNRKKRKYTKKTEKVSTVTFSKALVGIMPALIMTVAFVTTLVISLPFRNEFTHIQFSFQLPSVSFVGLITSIKMFGVELTKLAAECIQLFSKLWSNIIFYSVHLTDSAALMEHFLLQNALQISSWSAFPMLRIAIQVFSLFLGSMLALTLQGIYTFFVWLSYTFDIMSSLHAAGVVLNSIVITFIKALVLLFTTIGQILIQSLNTVLQFFITAAAIVTSWIASAVFVAIKAVGTAVTVSLHTCLVILMTIWIWLIFAANAIMAAIFNIVQGIIYIIEIPFKTLYTLWLVIKPYVDIFDHHVQITGADLSNGFKDLAQMPALLNKPQ